MIYFYLWVLFLLSIVLSVPIVAFVEKSKVKKAMGERADAGAAAAGAGEEVLLEDAEAAPASVEENFDEFAQANSGDADDFSAFDDFK
jgi:hypothetical protein